MSYRERKKPSSIGMR
ncbi:hypothetical protein U0070_000403 [Myodes glareolus]|uniref:Uncharacterized protein n=1 Tax=Myodes glareolus TaxID=447135 RepID=A0AAW0IAQ2_MYOGA